METTRSALPQRPYNGCTGPQPQVYISRHAAPSQQFALARNTSQIPTYLQVTGATGVNARCLNVRFYYDQEAGETHLGRAVWHDESKRGYLLHAVERKWVIKLKGKIEDRRYHAEVRRSDNTKEDTTGQSPASAEDPWRVFDVQGGKGTWVQCPTLKVIALSSAAAGQAKQHATMSYRGLHGSIAGASGPGIVYKQSILKNDGDDKQSYGQQKEFEKLLRDDAPLTALKGCVGRRALQNRRRQALCLRQEALYAHHAGV